VAAPRGFVGIGYWAWLAEPATGDLPALLAVAHAVSGRSQGQRPRQATGLLRAQRLLDALRRCALCLFVRSGTVEPGGKALPAG
jgi:hypothetical protein